MKRMSRLAVTLLPVLARAGGPAELESRVVSATVFPVRAMVTREAEAALTAGRQTFVFAGLTAELVDASVRVSGRSASGARILDVKTGTRFTPVMQDRRVRRLEAALDSLRGLDAEAADAAAALESQKAFVESLKAQAAEDVGKTLLAGRTAPRDWQGMVGFVGASLTDIHRGLRAEARRRKDLARNIEAAQNEMDRLVSGSGRAVKEIEVTVEADRPGRAAFRASYLVHGASWTPVYDARVSSESKSLSLAYSALVRQATGEDWNGVELTLSTAQPMTDRSLPEPGPWFVDFPEPPRPQAVMLRNRIAKKEMAAVEESQAAMPLEAGFAADAVEAPAPEAEAGFLEAEARSGPASTVFAVPTRSDVPSDNSPHKVTVALLALDAAFDHAAVPRLVPGAFLKAEAVHAAGYPLFAGEVNVFFENDFVNKTRIPTLSPTDTLRLALGVDDAVRVERKLVRRLAESKGLLGASTRITYDFEITVTNRKKSDVRITVKDQVPVSRNEKIGVALLAPEGGGHGPDPSGVVAWKLELKPGEIRRLPFRYEVRYPSGRTVEGLE